MKRRYIRLVPVHWLCILLYSPVIYFNYQTIADDYYMWQNKSGVVNLWLGWILNPFLMSSWIFAPLHYWNSVVWSVSCQAGFYFMFPFIARRIKRKLDEEESHIAALTCNPGRPRSGAGSSSHTTTITGVAVQELDARRINARYTYRARVLYALSILIPLLAIVFFNSPMFRDAWDDHDKPTSENGDEIVSELGNDLDGMRAYFIARSWPLFRLPVFLMGVLFAAKLQRAQRNGDVFSSDDYLDSWAPTTDKLGYFLAALCVGSSALTLGYQNKVLAVRFGTEFFLLLPTAHFIYGLCVSGNRSRVYRALTHWFPLALGKISYAAYLLQFPLWVYTDVVETGTFRDRFPPCDRYNPEDAKSWLECFAQTKDTAWPDFLVIWNVFLLFLVAFFVNKYYEKPVIEWLSKKLL